jgi:catechol 2,3-dioxygenase-like lactoylglutathione lyase family enzyme
VRETSIVGDVTIELVTFVVRDYDEAIDFFVSLLNFILVEDSPSVAESGRAKRWVVVRPPHGGTGLLLAEADGDEQRRVVGNQTGGRVAFFLRVDDFTEAYERMRGGGVEFLTEPREEPYGSVAIFRDISGNRWDLLGPPPAL